MPKINMAQYTHPRMIAFSVDGSAVTTSAAKTGLLAGAEQATVLKGTAGDANLVTFAFTRPFGRVDAVLITPRTIDCVARLEAAPTKTGFQVRTVELDGTTSEADADFDVLVIGSDYDKDGDYDR